MRRKVPASTLRTIWMPVLLSLVLLRAGLGNWNPSIAAPSAAPSAPSAENLKVMKTGLGSGTVASGAGDILCGADCDETYGSAVSVTLAATPDAGSIFAGWSGDCSGAATTCTVTMSAARSVRAKFNLAAAIPTITDFTAAGIESYVAANPIVNSPARFVAALPREFRQNWILMSRSESLQTGTAESPCILLPSADARFVFTIGMADIQKHNLDRTGDPYLLSAAPASGLIQQYGAATSFGTATSLDRIRQEVFRRPVDLGGPDATVMGGIYVDREIYAFNTEPVALYRYFLEPLGVSVDKWSMGVRGRSRTYTFADVFGSYKSTLISQLEASLGSNPVPGLAAPYDCTGLINAVNSTLSSLPAATALPTYTDLQRVFNTGCVECHGGLGYPPYGSGGLDFSEDEAPPAGGARLDRSYGWATAYTTLNPATSLIYQRITSTNEQCAPGGAMPSQRMPCGGPALSQADIETIRRWLVGGRPYTLGDPHIKTIDGVNYDFQSAGEFVLLRGENLEIQARQTAVETVFPLPPDPYTGLSSCVSINTAFALRVGGHRITYQPNLNGEPDPNGLQLRIDGKLVDLGDKELLLPSGGRIVRTAAPGSIQIEYPGGTVVAITPHWWDYQKLWYLDIDGRGLRATAGVMGAIAPGNWLPALPDGRLIGPMPPDLSKRYLDLYELFADSWRVSDATTLFDYAPGTSTGTFTIDSWPGLGREICTLPGEPGPKPPPQPLPEDVALQLRGDVVAEDRRAHCVQDVMATGEPGFAQANLLTEQVECNSVPTAPLLGLLAAR